MSKTITVLPYTLGGRDDPHFQDLSSRDVDVAPATGLPSHLDALSAQDLGGNFIPDRIKANQDIYGNEDDYWSLRDEGRSFGEGESYAERNA